MAAKVPYPRQLTSNETLDTLTHWKSHVRNYFRRDDNLKIFFARHNTWDPTRDNYGFAGEGNAEKADHLEGLLDTIAGFMPGPYLTAKITKQTTSMQAVFNVIWEHYDVDPNPSTFLDIADLALSKDERYIDLYYRMLYHAEMHLIKRGATVEGKVLAADETLSHSHKNLLALNWMQKLSSNLLSIVKLEKHKELKEGRQLYTMTNDVAKNVDDWLKRHGCKLPDRTQESLNVQVDSQVRNVRFEGYSKPSARGTGRGQFRGRGFRGNRGNRGSFNNASFNNRSNSTQQFAGPRKFCPGCNFVAQELSINVDWRHFPAECPRKQSVLRLLRAEEQNQFTEDDPDEEEFYEEDEHAPPEENAEGTSSSKNVQNITQKQASVTPMCTNNRKLENVHSMSMLNKSIVTPNSINAVWKSKSPTVQVKILNHPVTAVIDEGSEISAIDSRLVEYLDISVSRTVEEAKAAGSLPLNILGKTEQDIILYTNVKSSQIKWNLGQCLVVQNLGCNILLGEPAKERNNICTYPASKCITTIDESSNKVILSYSSSLNDYSMLSETVHNEKKSTGRLDCYRSSVVRMTKSHTVYPDHSISFSVPTELKDHAEVLIEPAENVKFPAPGIYAVHHGMVKLNNMGPYIEQITDNNSLIFSQLRKHDDIRPIEPTSVERRSHSTVHSNVDLRPVVPNSVERRSLSTVHENVVIPMKKLNQSSGIQCALNKDNKNIRKIYDLNESAMKQFEFPHIDRISDVNTLDQVSIDPDNRLSVAQKSIFADILHSYNDIITEVPGRYNGYYGQVNCTLTLTGNPPPSIKPRLPNYSEDKLNVIAKKMDEMEKWGVIVKPETIGVVPTHVHPCILVPKDDGKFRLVTDFRSIQSHIAQLPTVMPTVSDAMTALSSADFHIELDFSNYYWQNAIPRNDSEKLAICHPYGGLRVYTVCPQGLRNSAEWGSEILARIFGDMVQQKRCTRIADQVYVLGNSVPELIENFKVVMDRARNANLTFKPSKIIVCPQTTVILGWQKTGNEWFPTDHVLSPLSQAEPPSTVKKLRGWLGAYRQIAKTIPNHAVVLQNFEKMVGGKNSKDKIPWSPELLKEFDAAKNSIKTAAPIIIPRSSDKLQIYPDWSQDADAVGGRLIIERNEGGKKVSLHGGEFSCRLKGAQARWTPCEKECLAIKLLVQHYQPFIRESKAVTTIFTDNIVSVHAWNAIKLGKISTSSRVASFISTMCENNIQIVHLPGITTKVADFNSRHPITCKAEKCQTCKFIAQEILSHEHYVRYTNNVKEDVFLVERPTWLQLQKQDATLSKLHQLIRSGLSPEKKTKNRDLKLLHNMYRRGTLFIASDGLLQVKNVDVAHSAEFNATVVPNVYVSSVIQSLHLKLNHPSPYQLHKVMSRHFFAVGIAKLINNITTSCDTCARLKTLPKQAHKGTTNKNQIFGTNFSADILIEKGQHILLCREKLSQYTTTCFVQDEKKECVEEGIITSLLHLIPEDGTTIQVDPGPSLVSLANDQVNMLQNYNIKLEIGRVHNKQKNPVAENAIKEFRKEWLKLKPDGSSLSELERAQITLFMNKRIRLNGLAPKEFVLKRDLKSHAPLTVNDNIEGDKQYQRRTEVNEDQFIRDSVKKSVPEENIFKVGDLVYIIEDSSKSRAREQHIITKTFMKQNQQWIIVRKCQRGLRNKEYLLKSSEVFRAPVSKQTIQEPDIEEDDFQGFQENIQLDKREKLQQLIKNLEKSIPSAKGIGRPSHPVYPDYLNKLPSDPEISYEDEIFYGFQQYDVDSSEARREGLKKIIEEMENPAESEEFYGFSQRSKKAELKKAQFENMLLETRNLVSNLRKLRTKKVVCNQSYAWNYEQWVHILEHDDFEEEQIKSRNRRNVVMDLLETEEELDSLSYDDTEFHSLSAYVDDTAENMIDEEVLTMEDFNVFFEKHKESVSTPIKKVFRSETNPSLLDTITVMSSSDSSLDYTSDTAPNIFEENVFMESEPEKGTVPNGPVRLETILNEIHQICPELSEPVEGEVCQMNRILQNIHDYDASSTPEECVDIADNHDVPTDSRRNSRPKRTIERLDYKLLNHKGAAYKKKD